MATWRNLESSELTRPTNCEALPRVVEADGPRSLEDLRAFVTAERDRLREEMVKRGGVLLRGFEVNEPGGSWQLGICAIVLTVWLIVGLFVAQRVFRWTRRDAG